MIDRDRHLWYVHNRQALSGMDDLTYHEGYSPLDSFTVPRWIGLTPATSYGNIDYGFIHNPIARNFWHCPDCHSFKLRVLGTTPSCDGCHHLKKLYKEGTVKVGRFIGQCQKCGEFGPASCACHHCFRVPSHEVELNNGKLGNQVDGPKYFCGRFRVDGCNRRLDPYFDTSTGLYGLDTKTRKTNYLFDDQALKAIPNTAMDMQNFNCCKYEHDEKE